MAIVPASALAVYPEKMTPEEGTSIWMQYLTAYGALQLQLLRSPPVGWEGADRAH